MGDIVNLRQARKRRQRGEREAAAAENRRAHGTPRREREMAERLRAIEAERLEGHRLKDKD